MKNLLLRLTYDGTAYHGWQVQPNGITVQEKVQDAVETITAVRENVTGCSRTDAGVHANDFCCNFRTESSMDCFRMTGALNAVLPPDIRVKECVQVPDSFHARYSCTGKRYVYKIWNENYQNPFYINYACHYKQHLDEILLNDAAQSFLGTHDFSAFCAAGSSVIDTVRTVKSIGVERKGSFIILNITADGFLYNMVRITVGTLLETAEKRIGPDEIKDIISGCDRKRAGRTAPPQGLYLDKVFY